MKRFITLILMLLPFSAMASIPEIEALANDYSSTDGVTVVNLTDEMLKMTGGEGSDMTMGGEVIDSLLVIVAENKKHAKAITKKVDKILGTLDLQTISDINVDGTIVKVYMKQLADNKSELVMFVSEDSETALINITGEFTEETMGELLNQIGDI